MLDKRVIFLSYGIINNPFLVKTTQASLSKRTAQLLYLLFAIVFILCVFIKSRAASPRLVCLKLDDVIDKQTCEPDSTGSTFQSTNQI